MALTAKELKTAMQGDWFDSLFFVFSWAGPHLSFSVLALAVILDKSCACEPDQIRNCAVGFRADATEGISSTFVSTGRGVRVFSRTLLRFSRSLRKAATGSMCIALIVRIIGVVGVVRDVQFIRYVRLAPVR